MTTSWQTRDDRSGKKATAIVMATGNASSPPSRDLSTTITTTTANDHMAGDAAVGAGGSWRCE